MLEYNLSEFRLKQNRGAGERKGRNLCPSWKSLGFVVFLESADVDDSLASCKRQAEQCSGVFQGAWEALPNEVV